MKKNNIILGVNSFLGGPHHDNGAFLFVGDDYVGINSERLDREKYSSGYKWKISKNGIRVLYAYDKCESCIQYCLEHFGITELDIDQVVYLEGLPSYVQSRFPHARITGMYDHHFLHALGSYFTSHYNDAAILVMDGQGKRIENGQDIMVLQSIYHGVERNVEKIYETTWSDTRKIGVGTAYEMFTRLFGFGSEGTTMGLSSYSNNQKVLKRDIFSKYETGHYIDDFFTDGISGPRLKFLPPDIFGKKLGISQQDLELEKLPYGYSAQLAGQLQSETERVIIELANRAYEKTKSKNLCISEGVGLNSVANTKIIENTPFENVYIMPSCDDSGLALGAALYGKEVLLEESSQISNFYFGTSYNEQNIQAAIKKYQSYFSSVETSKDIYIQTAELIEKGNVVGWFQGRSESGPRALGNRSIIADPRSTKIRDKVNSIKKREGWRPLAPSVLGEYAKEHFILSEPPSEYKYMLKVVPVNEKGKKEVPGTVHIDNTARIQTVFQAENEKYYKLIHAFQKISGIPMVLNTSFNSAGEPIVETPEEAIRMFLSSQLDALVLGDTILYKSQVFPEFGFQKSIELQDKMYASWKQEIQSYELLLSNIDRYKTDNFYKIS